MSAFFVTGAGTDIGKTYVSCALLEAWRARGIPCAALKPVVSGFDENACAESDPGRLLSALGVAPSLERIARISPWRYAAPLAPPLAATAENAEVPFDDVVDFCRAQMRASGGRLLIEGAGGVMAPISEHETNLDLVIALDAPVIFVAGDYLGAVSHALTGLEVLRAVGASIGAIVVSESSASVGLDATRAMIAAHAAEPIYPAPRGAPGEWAARLADRLT